MPYDTGVLPVHFFYELQLSCCLQVDLFTLFNVRTTEVFSSLCSN